MKFNLALKLKLIYMFRNNDGEHKGIMKIGEASSDTENNRQTQSSQTSCAKGGLFIDINQLFLTVMSDM